MHDAYDFFKDIALPAFTAIGSIGVGVIAAFVALQSHNLAVQVRKDEVKRDEAASRERYRDQLFQTVEPAVTALLAHRAQVIEGQRLGTAAERNMLSNAIARLRIVDVVASSEDRPLLRAVINAYQTAAGMRDLQVLRAVLGSLAIILAGLLEEGRDVPELVRQAEEAVQEAIEAGGS